MPKIDRDMELYDCEIRVIDTLSNTIYQHVYECLGQTYLVQTINPEKTGKWDKRYASLEVARDLLQNNVIINPSRSGGWGLLASTYLGLIEAFLHLGPDTTIQRFDEIHVLARRAFLCYQRALALGLTGNPLYWEEFGRLVFMISSRPLWHGEELLGLRSEYDAFYDLPQSQLRELCRQLFTRAREIEGAEDPGWFCPYMLGKLHEKLGSEPAAYLGFYMDAVRLNSNPKCLEPSYRLLSSLIKLVSRGHVSPPVEKVLIQVAGGVTVDCLIAKLNELNTIDRWYHKAIFRRAQIAGLAGDWGTAKRELQQLVSLKVTTTKFWNVWRTEYDLPGKFFLYAKRIILLMIRALEEIRDGDGLMVVLKRVRRASNDTYNVSGVVDAAQSSIRTVVCSLVPDIWPKLTSVGRSRLEAVAVHLQSVDVLPDLRTIKRAYECLSFSEGHADIERAFVCAVFGLSTEWGVEMEVETAVPLCLNDVMPMAMSIYEHIIDREVLSLVAFVVPF